MTTSKAEPATSSPSYPRTLSGQFRRHLPAYALGTVCLATFQYAMNRIDRLTKHVVDMLDALANGSGDSQTALATFHLHPFNSPLGADLLVLLATAILAFVVRVLSRLFIFNAGRAAEYELRAEILRHLHQLGAAYFRKTSTGDIMSRSTNDLLQVRLLLGFGVLNLANVTLAFASSIDVMRRVSWRLTGIALLMLPVIVLLTRGFSKNLFQATRKAQESLGKLTDEVQSSLAGVRVVRSFGMEAFQLEQFRRINGTYLAESLRLARLRGILGPIAGTASALGLLAFFWYGSTLLKLGEQNGGISKGGFFSFWMSLGRLTWPIIALGFSVAIVQRGRAGMQRLRDLFQERPEIEVPAAALEAKGSKAVLEPRLEVRGLTYRQQDKCILHDVSFALEPGQSLAIMGRTGAGKSTLGALLARLLPTPRGTVFFGGEDVCDLPPVRVRSNIGYAPQEAFLFSTTVESNIAFGAGDQASHDAVLQAASDAQVHDEVLTMSDGYDTVVGERGVQLSGGQKQRIALARALLIEPSVLVLDDPMSAVDTKTEGKILDAIERQKAQRTLVLITHRVRAAQLCDRVLVLDEGRVVQLGKPADLLQEEGVFALFAREQSNHGSGQGAALDVAGEAGP
jgi:ATP-binding cassette, subfamily B, multidrug efflux pump